MTTFQNIAVVENEKQGGDRRDAWDRRSRPTPMLSRYWLFGRRRDARRDEGSRNIYVDRYSGGELFLIFGVLALSVLDMVFTLFHLNAGGAEANPIMAWTLDVGGHSFFKFVKLLTTFIGLFILLVHVKFRRVKALLTFTFVLYSALFVFHLYLVYLRAQYAA